jgi:hypothetical protein
VRGTLLGDEIDTIITREIAVKALANERARRAAWKIVEKKRGSVCRLRIGRLMSEVVICCRCGSS